MSYATFGMGQLNPALQTAAAQISAKTALSPSQIKQLTTSTTRTQVERSALDAARASLQINVPSYCGNIGSMLEGIAYPVAGPQLAPRTLYVAVWPLLQKLSPTQASQLSQRFAEAMDPAAARYPVQTTTPCALTFRRAEACMCRDRKNPAKHQLHHPGTVGNSWDVQRCMSKDKTKAARHWISFFHNLYGWTQLPYGYREINGEPVFIWTVELNPDPKKEFYSPTGAVVSGNLKAKQPASLPLVQVRNYAQAKLRAAATSIGVPGSKVSPGIVLHVDRFDWPAVAREAKNVKAMMTLAESAANSTTIKGSVPAERTLDWDSRRYRKDGSKLGQAYRTLVNQAILQAAAYGRESTTAVWQTVGSLLVGGLVSRTTDRQLRGIYATGFRRTQTFGNAAALVANAEALSAATEQQAKSLLDLPDPAAAYPVLKQMRFEVQAAIQTVQTAMGALSTAPQSVGAVYKGAADSGASVQRGLREAIAKLNAKSAKWATPLKQRWTCLLYKKARSEQQQWPVRLIELGDAMKVSVATFASVSAQAPAAIARFNEVLETIAYVEGQLGLSWWQKDYGPLPGWAWGAVGAAGFLGGAFYLRKKRRGRPTKNLRRRTSRRR